jgi:hypothetical protein
MTLASRLASAADKIESRTLTKSAFLKSSATTIEQKAAVAERIIISFRHRQQHFQQQQEQINTLNSRTNENNELCPNQFAFRIDH